jgi:hypothetical protein
MPCRYPTSAGRGTAGKGLHAALHSGDLSLCGTHRGSRGSQTRSVAFGKGSPTPTRALGAPSPSQTAAACRRGAACTNRRISTPPHCIHFAALTCFPMVRAHGAAARQAPSPLKWSHSIPPLRKYVSPLCKYLGHGLVLVSASKLGKTRKGSVFFSFAPFAHILAPGEVGFSCSLPHRAAGAQRTIPRGCTTPAEGASPCQFRGSSPQSSIRIRISARPRPSAWGGQGS